MRNVMKTVSATAIVRNDYHAYNVVGIERRRQPRSRIGAQSVPMRRPVVTENLLDDFFYCEEWAESNYVIVRNAVGESLFLLTAENIRVSLSKVVAAVNAGAILAGSCWSIEELLSADNFKQFCKVDADAGAIRVVIEIAEHWLRLPEADLGNMEATARSVTKSWRR